MPFDPNEVGNKTRGDIIQSTDWNALVEEVVAVNTRNVSKNGDSLTGPLSFGNTPTPMLYMFESGGTVSRPVLSHSPANANWGLRYDDNTDRFHFQRAGAPVLTTDLNAQRIGINASAPASALDIAGGNWNVTSTEGDLRIGSATHRLKIGVATAGGGAGDVRIRAEGGTNRVFIGGGNNDTLTVTQDGVAVGFPAGANPYATLTVNGSIGFPNSTDAMFFIHQSGGSNAPRPVIAHSPSFPDWGLWYEDVGDNFVFKRAGTDVVRVNLGRQDAALASGGYFTVGALTATNITIDGEEIQARNNGAKSTLYLNHHGGSVRIRAAQSEATSVVFQDNGYVGIRETAPVAPLHVAGTNDLSLSTHGLLVLGNINSTNMALDGNEIQVRSNGAASTLHLNYEGGSILACNQGTGEFRFGPSNKYIRLRNTGTQLDIDVSSGDHLYINNGGTGSVFVRNAVHVSTRTIKDNIFDLPLDDAYNILEDLMPVCFHYTNDPNQRTVLGFIAEDVPDIIASDDHKAINYNSIVATLTGIVRDQSKQLEGLRDELTHIRHMIGQD